MGVPWKFSTVPDYAKGSILFSKFLIGFCSDWSYHFLVWMCVQNLKFVALPVREIVGGTQKLDSHWIRSRSVFSYIFNRLLFWWTLWMYRPNLKSVVWDNNDWRLGAVAKRMPWGREWYERALVRSYRPFHFSSIGYLYAFQRYCRICAPARHFSHAPTSSLHKISPCSHGRLAVVLGG